MLQKLKSFLTFAPLVEFVNYRDGLLVVRSKKALKTSNNVVKLKTHLGTVLAEVLVESFDTNEQVYRMKLFNIESVLSEHETDRRDYPRLSKVLRVTSQSFPGYSANTEDISCGGVRVVTSGPLELGSIDFQLELDDPDVPPLNINADVCWTAVKYDKQFHSGLRFQQISPTSEKHIREYIRHRINMEKRLHTLEEVEPPI